MDEEEEEEEEGDAPLTTDSTIEWPITAEGALLLQHPHERPATAGGASSRRHPPRTTDNYMSPGALMSPYHDHNHNLADFEMDDLGGGGPPVVLMDIDVHGSFPRDYGQNSHHQKNLQRVDKKPRSHAPAQQQPLVTRSLSSLPPGGGRKKSAGSGLSSATTSGPGLGGERGARPRPLSASARLSSTGPRASLASSVTRASSAGLGTRASGVNVRSSYPLSQSQSQQRQLHTQPPPQQQPQPRPQHRNASPSWTNATLSQRAHPHHRPSPSLGSSKDTIKAASRIYGARGAHHPPAQPTSPIHELLKKQHKQHMLLQSKQQQHKARYPSVRATGSSPRVVLSPHSKGMTEDATTSYQCTYSCT